MTTVTEPAPTTEARPHRGGRPRDPSRGPAILDAVIDLLALVGLEAITADTIAAEAGVGKATIYRRWHAIDDVIAQAVATLGVRPEDLGAESAWHKPLTSLRGDVHALVQAAVTGQRAHAERAIMSALPYRPAVQRAYAVVQRRLDDAIGVVMIRAVDRGDAVKWPGAWRIKAAIAFLHQSAMAGRIPDVAFVVDDIVWGVR